MRKFKLLMFVVSLSLFALSSSLIYLTSASVKPLVVHNIDYYNGKVLAPWGQSGNGFLSPAYNSVLALYPYLNSATPSGYSIGVGYVPASGGTGTMTTLTAPGLGSYCGSGNWKAIFGNFGSNQETCNFEVDTWRN